MNNSINNEDANIECRLFSPKKINISYLSLLFEYNHNNQDFMKNNPELFKRAIIGVLKDPQIHNNFKHINKIKYQIVGFFSYAIDNKDAYGNDWLTDTINKYFQLNLPKSKEFYNKLDILSHKLFQLEFIVNPMSDVVRNIAKGNSPIEYHENLSFFCKVDANKLIYKQKNNSQFFSSNFRLGLSHLKNILDNNSAVSFTNNFDEPSNQVFSIVVLHNSSELQDKLKKFVDYMCYNIDHNIQLNTENMPSVYLRFEMENEISKNDIVKKTSLKI